MASYFKSRNKRQDKRLRELSKLSKWRQRKTEIRQERIAAGLLEREPKFEKWHRFEFGVRDKLTGSRYRTFNIVPDTIMDTFAAAACP